MFERMLENSTLKKRNAASTTFLKLEDFQSILNRRALIAKESGFLLAAP